MEADVFMHKWVSSEGIMFLRDKVVKGIERKSESESEFVEENGQ